MPKKRLFLLRHAKSSWDEPKLDDHDRPLAPRGRRATKAIAAYLRDERIAPGLVLCSSARRAQETLERIAVAWDDDVAVEVEWDLYAGSAERLLDRVRAVDEGVESVMLVGHNPAIQSLALDLARSGEKLAAAQRKFPTGALATLTFAGRWRDLDPGGAELSDFVKPKQLAKR